MHQPTLLFSNVSRFLYRQYSDVLPAYHKFLAEVHVEAAPDGEVDCAADQHSVEWGFYGAEEQGAYDIRDHWQYERVSQDTHSRLHPGRLAVAEGEVCGEHRSEEG